MMDVDSAQYASISREMTETGNYLQVMHRGQDYLDKPPLLFWMSSFFFKLFSFQNWSFKIGAFLFTLLGVYSTFRLGKLLYNVQVGRLAAIMLFTCQAFFLFNNDLRTDTILTGAVIFAIWQLTEWFRENKWRWLIGGAVGVALAMLAKGPIGLMIPILALGSYLIGIGQWRDLFRWEYFVGLAIVAVMLTPMLYGLHRQFDMQPEKIVRLVSSNGTDFQTGVSGIKFFLWTQSFGRITGENIWKDDSGPFFFVHNFIWSFLPWALLFIFAFFDRVTDVTRAFLKGGKLPELLTLLGFLLPFVALSMSNYKLPHYIFVLYPLASVLLAGWWYEKVISLKRINNYRYNLSLFLQLLVVIAGSMVIYLIYFHFFLGATALEIAIPFGGIVVAVYLIFKPVSKAVNLMLASAIVSISVNYTMNGWFYPELMKYQAGSNLGYVINKKGVDPKNVFFYHYSSFSYGYYVQSSVKTISDNVIKDRLKKDKQTYVVTDQKGFRNLQRNFDLTIEKKINSYMITNLSMDFLLAETRQGVLKPHYLLKINRENK